MTDRPHPIDVYVGKRLRARRTLIGMSQERLADELGITFQQIQKYERGANRVGSSRLFEVARVLGVPVAYFFEAYESNQLSLDGSFQLQQAPRLGLADEAATFVGPGEETAPPADIEFDKRQTLELVRAYQRLHNPELKRRVFDMVKALASLDESSKGQR
ncbi:MAG: helix-turn-helix domain-containing protein [Geminicoccaceae bacterium]